MRAQITRMQIRKAVIADIPTIQQIAEETWRPTYSHILTEEQTLYMLDLMYAADVLQKQIEGTVEFFMVAVDDEAIGYFAIPSSDPFQFVKDQLIYQTQFVDQRFVDELESPLLPLNL